MNSSAENVATCELCGEPMPAGETMFKFHGFSGPCPKPPLPKTVEEKGWIIERWIFSELFYWSGTPEPGFSKDSLKAIRFCRYQDAAHILNNFLGGIGKVSEHVWIGPEEVKAK